MTDGELLYESPLQRRVWLAASIVTAAAFMVALLVGAIEGSPYFIATILGVLVLVGLGVIVHRLLPTRIEVRAGEVRLLAPRATTKYEAGKMVLGMRPSGTWEFARREPMHRLAFFRDPDHDRVRRAFEAAGVQVWQGPETV